MTESTALSKTQLLMRRVSKAKEGGGRERAEAQRRRGKLTARERLDLLLDEGSFEEFDMFVETQNADFGLDKKRVPGDGVVTGVGTIDGRKVGVFAQDFTVMGGSLGLAHAMKICKVMDFAVAHNFPVIGLCDSGGARIQEGVESLGGYAEIFYRNVQASGRVPQISAILGPCAGGAVYSPALTDFVFMVEGTSHMFITGPEVIRAATGEECDFDSLGGAEAHATKSGVAHFIAGSEQDCMRQIRELLAYLPPSCFERAPKADPVEDPTQDGRRLEEISEMDPKRAYDVHEVIAEIADGRGFFEVHKDFARNLVCGFVHLGGRVVGVVANNSSRLSGALDIDASDKGGRFVRFCDSFNIPLLTLVDVPGYWPGLAQEHGGIIRHGAKLLYAYAQADVPKVALVLRKAYGGAYDVMSSKHIRGDLNFAWPSAEIAVMGPQGAVNILFARELKQAENPEKRRAELIREYTERYASPYQAAERGYIDRVIPARDTRRTLIKAFDFLEDKKTPRIAKKHGNIPL